MPLAHLLIEDLGNVTDRRGADPISEQARQSGTRLPGGNTRKKNLLDGLVDRPGASLITLQDLSLKLARAGAGHVQFHGPKRAGQGSAIKAVGLIAPVLLALVGLDLKMVLPVVNHQLIQE